jgi:excisionase family DNA binding protein
MKQNPLMNFNSLTEGERSYVLGLYLADGSLSKQGKEVNSYQLYFSLQGNEGEMAGKLVRILKKSDLRPHTYRRRTNGGNNIFVEVYCSNLIDFFPDKEQLLRDEEKRAVFFQKNDLLTNPDNRLAFSAGLMDGDGTCKAYLDKHKSRFGQIHVEWVFSQSSYDFLLDFLLEFVESFVHNSTHIAYAKRCKSERSLQIRCQGRQALIKAGISMWSWKVAKYLKLVSELLRERERIRNNILTLKQVASSLSIDRKTVLRSCQRGEIRYHRSRGRYYFDFNEVERFLQENQKAERMKDGGMKLVDASKLLGISRYTLWKWYTRGKFHALFINLRRGLGYRCIVIPLGEVKRLSRYIASGTRVRKKACLT